MKGAGAPALLRFKPEELPTGCRTTPSNTCKVKPLYKAYVFLEQKFCR